MSTAGLWLEKMALSRSPVECDSYGKHLTGSVAPSSTGDGMLQAYLVTRQRVLLADHVAIATAATGKG
jgi:hypothetical protein